MLNEGQSITKGQLWFQFVRTGKGNLRENSKSLFYPIYIDPDKGKIVRIGESIPLGVPKESVPVPDGQLAIWPITADGREARWRTGIEVANRRLSKGLLRLGKTSKKESGWSVLTVNEGTEKRIESGEVVIEKVNETGAAILVEKFGGSLRAPKTVWNKVSHNAGWHGSKLLSKILLERKFPYPKSLYAVEDVLRIVTNKDALIVGFFAGSGTTMHAVNLLNKEDGGNRKCIMVTNNEMNGGEESALTKKGYKPGDRKIVGLEERFIKQYNTIVSDGDIVSKHNFRLPETISLPHEVNGKDYEDHLFVDDHGKARISLNSWEEDVLIEEQNPGVGRIQLIRMVKDAGQNRFKRLDMAMSAVRDKVSHAMTNDELDHIFDMDGFFMD